MTILGIAFPSILDGFTGPEAGGFATDCVAAPKQKERSLVEVFLKSCQGRLQALANAREAFVVQDSQVLANRLLHHNLCCMCLGSIVADRCCNALFLVAHRLWGSFWGWFSTQSGAFFHLRAFS